VFQIAHAGAAVGVLDGDAEQAQIAHLAPEVRWEGIVAVDSSGARRDLVGRECLHLAAQHVHGFAKVEVQGEVRVETRRHVRFLICFSRVSKLVAQPARALLRVGSGRVRSGRV